MVIVPESERRLAERQRDGRGKQLAGADVRRVRHVGRIGAVSLALVRVSQGDSAPVAEVVQPEGSAGAVTPSKFSKKS